MSDDGGSAPEAERYLLNLERLAAEGDVELVDFSLDLYGEGFGKLLHGRQAGRLATIRERLAELQSSGLDETGACPPGMR